jgi:hypothetical protein
MTKSKRFAATLTNTESGSNPMSIDSQYPAHAYGTGFRFANGEPPKPRNKSGTYQIEYVIKDRDAHEHEVVKVTLEYVVNHYPGQREFEYELCRDPEIVSVNEIIIKGYEIPMKPTSDPEMIKYAWELVRDGDGLRRIKEHCLREVVKQ